MANIEQVAQDEAEKIGPAWDNVMTGEDFLQRIRDGRVRFGFFENAILVEADTPHGLGVWELAHASEAARFLDRPA